MQNIFSLQGEHSGFIEKNLKQARLNCLNLWYNFFQAMQRKTLLNS